MNRRGFLRQSALAMAGAALGYGQSSRRPNIILILADDLGYECLGCNGGTSYKTPHLDALAASGIRWTHAYAQPLCAPTRLQLMTGQYNFRNYEAFGILHPKEKTFGHLMKQAGYRTCLAGKWQLFSYNPPDYDPKWRGKGMLAKDSGFDEYCVWHGEHTEDKGSRYADPTLLQNGELRKVKGGYGEDVFVSFIADFIGKRSDQPFFVYYPMVLTHDPFVPTPRSAEWKSDDRLKANPRLFADMVEYMDESVGRLVSHLDKLGLRDNTLILFFSDNGSPRVIESRMGDRVIRGGKGTTTDAGTHVPMIANWRGTAPAGKVFDDLVDSTDFAPTLANAAGVKFTCDGRSFFPRLRGEKGNPREWIYSWYDPRPGWDKDEYTLKIFARDRRFKLYSTGELFDVAADPDEQQAISPQDQSSAAGSARARLKKVLEGMKDSPRSPLRRTELTSG